MSLFYTITNKLYLILYNLPTVNGTRTALNIADTYSIPTINFYKGQEQFNIALTQLNCFLNSHNYSSILVM